jgi:hypothetical protein
MKKHWEVSYEGHSIRVENCWLSGERLLVDGELQDERKGLAYRSTLWGRLLNEAGQDKTIKLTLGGWFVINCRIFVDDTLVHS